MENHHKHSQQIHPWVAKPTLPPNDKSRPFLDSTSPSTYLVDPSTTVSTLRPVVRSHGDPHSFNSGSNTNSRASLNLAQTYFKAREDHVLEKHDSISKLQNSIFCVSFFKFYERESSSPHHSSKQVVCDDLLWENIANLQHRFFSPPGLRQHAIDIKEKKKNAICRTGHWDRSKQKVLKRVIQEEGESSRWSKKPFLERKIFFLAPLTLYYSWPPT